MILILLKRELRVAMRQRSTYVLQLIAVFLVIISILELAWWRSRYWQIFGRPLTNLLLQTFFFAGWILFPLLTADCISRERREHTLELIFLSGATAKQIVLAKAFAQGLRALTFWIAVVPVLTFSISLKSITRVEALVSGMFILNGAVGLWGRDSGFHHGTPDNGPLY
jgi:ABC-type transport system involved in multi-copper enzyme maturation permease subunit